MFLGFGSVSQYIIIQLTKKTQWWHDILKVYSFLVDKYLHNTQRTYISLCVSCDVQFWNNTWAHTLSTINTAHFCLCVLGQAIFKRRVGFHWGGLGYLGSFCRTLFTQHTVTKLLSWAWSMVSQGSIFGFLFSSFLGVWRVGVGVVSSSTVQGTIAYLMHDIQDMASSLRVVCLSSDGIGAAGAHRCLQCVQQCFAITTHLNKTQHFAVTVSQLQTVLFTC